MSDPRQQLFFSDFHSAHAKAESTPVHKRSFFVVHGIDMSFLKFCMVLDVFFVVIANFLLQELCLLSSSD